MMDETTRRRLRDEIEGYFGVKKVTFYLLYKDQIDVVVHVGFLAWMFGLEGFTLRRVRNFLEQEYPNKVIDVQ